MKAVIRYKISFFTGVVTYIVLHVGAKSSSVSAVVKKTLAKIASLGGLVVKIAASIKESSLCAPVSFLHRVLKHASSAADVFAVSTPYARREVAFGIFCYYDYFAKIYAVDHVIHDCF